MSSLHLNLISVKFRSRNLLKVQNVAVDAADAVVTTSFLMAEVRERFAETAKYAAKAANAAILIDDFVLNLPIKI